MTLGLDVSPPVIAMVSLLGVSDYHIGRGPYEDVEHSFDRDALLLPDCLVEDLAADPAGLLRPAFDAMWQASGWMRCFSYDQAGNRVAP